MSLGCCVSAGRVPLFCSTAAQGGVGTHYVISGVCLGYREREMEKGVTIVTHTHTYDDIIYWPLLWPARVHPLLRVFPAPRCDFWEPQKNILFHPPLTFVQSRTKLFPLVPRGLVLHCNVMCRAQKPQRVYFSIQFPWSWEAETCCAFLVIAHFPLRLMWVCCIHLNMRKALCGCF